MDMKSILVRPIITEKASVLTERNNQVVFEVVRKANKHQIRDAVESAYGVEVKKLATMIVPGKLKRRGMSIGKRSNWKKAIVTLKDGDSIDFFATE
jgi:large subunit ribosomal protein L23